MCRLCATRDPRAPTRGEFPCNRTSPCGWNSHCFAVPETSRPQINLGERPLEGRVAPIGGARGGIRAVAKQRRAVELVTEAWGHRRAAISTQVLQEFYINITRKIPQPVPLPTARRLAEHYLAWPVQVISPADVLRASEVQERWDLPFWDALILVAAARSGAKHLLTEDLNHGQVLEGVQVQNPFR